MSDTLDEDHAQLALDLLRADVALTVYDGVVPNPTLAPLEPVDAAPTPYVLVYAVVSRPADMAGAANTLDGRSATFLVRWYCHCVGASASAARIVAGRVRAALLDVRPTLTGRTCGMIRQDGSMAPQRDESTGRVVMDAVSIYSLVTTP